MRTQTPLPARAGGGTGRERDEPVGRLRSQVTDATNIVVKVGSSSLTTMAGGIDPDRVDELVDVLVRWRTDVRRIILVSSGAIAAGLAPLGLDSRPGDLATQQAVASVGQGLLIARYSASADRYGIRVGQVLLTAEDMARRTQYRNAYRTLQRLLAIGVLPVVNENDTVATQEIRFGDNDRLAALVAHLIRADLLVLLSDVDGLYDDAANRPESSRIADVHGPSDLAAVQLGTAGPGGFGTGGMISKVEAAGMATAAGIPVLLTSLACAADGLAGRPVGTMFHPTGRCKSSLTLWLTHATMPRGRLHLDPGGARAVVDQQGSLLPGDIAAIAGDFCAGDPIDILDGDGRAVARGLVNFDASDLSKLLARPSGRRSDQAYRRAVVYRDSLVLLPPVEQVPPLAAPANSVAIGRQQ
jgi:glutamate 5-kinase